MIYKVCLYVYLYVQYIKYTVITIFVVVVIL